ncbi:MAG: YqgE/AlgH family protein [Paracoccaceae bacterium]
MLDTNDSIDLTGKLLIAMPGMGDPRFEKSVVFICVHSPEETMGLIVNKPVPGLRLKNLFEQLKITGSGGSEATVQYGGPVEGGRGFVLHSGAYLQEGVTLRVIPAISMTADKEILQVMAEDKGPEQAVLMLGYAGWGPGQLEQEIVHNGWLITDASADLVFGDDNSVKWVAALKTLGIEPSALSASAGRA